MDTNKSQLAKRFFNLRQKLNSTQQEMAELFNVHLTTWQDWEYGITLPVSKHLRMLGQFEKDPPKAIKISDMCRIIRNKLGLRKYQMANLFEVAPNTWGYWETDKMKPSNEFIEKIKNMYVQLTEKEDTQKAS
ncbi:MAG: hypothetical protein WAQ98_20585 [Blastocatellia bacterium]